MNLRTYLRSRGSIAAGVLYLSLSLLCSQIPLLNYLGYEFSFVMALAGSCLAGFQTVAVVRKSYRFAEGAGLSDPDGVRGTFRAAASGNLIQLLIPLVISVANAFFVKNCSLDEGLAYFVLLPAVSVFFSSCLGLFCTVHYRRSMTIFLLIMAATFVYAIGLGYFTPAIFSYNFFYGYFPGLTYDEALHLSWTLVAFRIFTIFIAFLFLRLASLLVRNTQRTDSFRKKGIALLQLLAAPGRRWNSAVVVLILVCTYVFRCPLGFESTSAYVQKMLGTSFSTDHFTIYFDSSSMKGEEVRWIAAEHEFRLDQILDAFSLLHFGRVASYIYPSADAKRQLIGAGNTNIAKPWTNEIHLTRQSLDGTLKHELVHVVAGRFGLPVIHASLSTGLVEGLAMAVDWEWGNRTLHEYAAAMRANGVAPDIRGLMRFTGFASHSSSISYVLAGSFCRYLIDRFGIRRIMLLYRSGDYEATYGRSLNALVNEWQGFLDRYPVTQGDSDAVDALFRRPPIFGKVCARIIARNIEEARARFVAKNIQGASVLYRQAYEDSRSFEALSGYIACAIRLGEYAIPVRLYDSVMVESPHPALYLPLMMSVGDAFWARGDSMMASVLYERLRRADITDAYTEAASLRLHGLRDPESRLFLRYFVTDADDSVHSFILDSINLGSPDDQLARFLRGKLLLREGKFEEAWNVLKTIDMAEVDPRLEASRLTATGLALFRLKKFQEAKATYWLSLNFHPGEAAYNDVITCVERCEWMSAHGF